MRPKAPASDSGTLARPEERRLSADCGSPRHKIVDSKGAAAYIEPLSAGARRAGLRSGRRGFGVGDWVVAKKAENLHLGELLRPAPDLVLLAPARQVTSSCHAWTNGVETVGKVATLAVPLPAILLGNLIAQGFGVEGSGQGILHLLKPNRALSANPRCLAGVVGGLGFSALFRGFAASPEAHPQGDWEREDIEMAQTERPTTVTLVAWLVILMGAMTLLAVPYVLRMPDAHDMLEEAGRSVAVAVGTSAVGGALGVACGLAMLRAANWGRLLYLWVTPLLIVVGWILYGFSARDLPSVVFYVVVLGLLTTPDASGFFRGDASARAVPPLEAGPPETPQPGTPSDAGDAE